MREDMFKVIVERPRWGSRHATKSKLRYDKCEDRSRVSGRRLAMEVGYTKCLNENLAPLKRYLHKQVGRCWNDVFSEICQHLDTGSTVRMHVREHLDDFIDRQVRRKADGILWSTQGWGGETKLVDSWVELYVDPDDGIIKETRTLCKKSGVLFARNRWKQKKLNDSKKPIRIHKIGDLRWHAKFDGIWYLIEVSETPISKEGYPLNDNALYASIQQNTWQYYGWRVVKKAQLPHKVLRANGLANQYKDEGTCYG